MPEDLKEGFIVTANYEMPKDADAKMPTTGARNGMELAELRGAEYEDGRWETALVRKYRKKEIKVSVE